MEALGVLGGATPWQSKQAISGLTHPECHMHSARKAHCGREWRRLDDAATCAPLSRLAPSKQLQRSNLDLGRAPQPSPGGSEHRSCPLPNQWNKRGSISSRGADRALQSPIQSKIRPLLESHKLIAASPEPGKRRESPGGTSWPVSEAKALLRRRTERFPQDAIRLTFVPA